jgi:tRNA threonylcarbamoyladenosine biosynthesis protein TsaE
LRGDLGAGKSVLSRAIASGAGVRGPMPSPTFNLVLRHTAPDGVVVLHIDLFRLEDPDEVWELGWRDLGADDEIVLIEWPERAEALLPPDRWEIHLLHHAEPHLRIVSVVAMGEPPVIPQP